MSDRTAALRDGGERQALPWTGFITGMARVIRDPRIAGVLRAGPRVMDFLARATARIAAGDSVIAVRPTPALAAQAYLDKVLIAAFRHPDLLPREDDYAPAAAVLHAAHELFEAKGWIDHAAGYHRDPPSPQDVRRRTSTSPDSATSTRPPRVSGART